MSEEPQHLTTNSEENKIVDQSQYVQLPEEKEDEVNDEISKDEPFKSRMTVVESVVFQSSEDDPVSRSYGYDREIDSSDEQPYGPRKITVSEEWTSLAKNCWVTSPGMIVISNEEGKKLAKLPTEEQIYNTAQKVIEIAYISSPVESTKSLDQLPIITQHSQQIRLLPSSNVFAYILPGETARFTPANFNRLYVRCRKNTAKVELFILPL